jgi:hypothetical protein
MVEAGGKQARGPFNGPKKGGRGMPCRRNFADSLA